MLNIKRSKKDGFAPLIIVLLIALIASVGYYIYVKNGPIAAISSSTQVAATGAINAPGNVYSANDYLACTPTSSCSSTTTLAVSWTYQTGTETLSSFWIIRSTNGGTPTVIAKVLGTKVPGNQGLYYFEDKTAVQGNSYNYYVKAVGAAGSSATSVASPSMHVYPQTTSTILPSQAGFKAANGSIYDRNNITLTQTTSYKINPYTSGLQVYRKTGTGSWVQISPQFVVNPISLALTSIIDRDTHVLGTTYSYMVRYYNKPFNFSRYSTAAAIIFQ